MKLFREACDEGSERACRALAEQAVIDARHKRK
jgi:hypothetical protein